MDGRRSVARLLQRALRHFPRARPFRRERRMFRDGARRSSPTRSRRVTPGNHAQPRACPVQQARDGRLRPRPARKARRMAPGDDQGPARRSSIRRDHVLEHFTRSSTPIAQGPRPSGRADARSAAMGAGTRSRRSSIRASHDTWPHATRGLRAGDREDQGEGDAVRHPQLRRRPELGTRCCSPGGITAPSWARMLWFAGCGLACWARYWARGSLCSCGFHPWKHDDRKLIGKAESDYADALLPGAKAA